MRQQRTGPGIPKSGDEGFTLIEVLAVLVLTGALVGATTMVTGHWLQAWDRGADRLQAMEGVALAFDRIAADLQAAVPMTVLGADPPPSFVGTATSLTFVRPAFERSSAAALDIVRLGPGPAGLLRTRAPYAEDRPLASAPTGDPVRLITRPLVVRFAFRDESGRWQADWREVRLPEAVRVTVASPQGSTLSTVVGLRMVVPAFCAQATSFSTCRALASGQTVGLPDIEAASARTGRARLRRGGEP